MYSPKRRFKLFRTFVTVDALRLQLTTSLAAYDAASTNDWVKITQSEYANIFSNIAGATKRGNTDVQVATRAVAAGYNEAQFSDPADDNTAITINTGEYAIAFVAETWNQTGTVQFGTTTTFHTGAPTYGNAVTVNPVGANYYLQKTPSSAAGQTLYPGIKSTQSFNLVPSTRGWATSNGGATWTSTGGTTPKFQMIVTSTKSW